MSYKYNGVGWYVLRVKSLHERKIYELLSESSIEAFLPLVKTVRNWSDRKKIILKPLFPSYIFVNIQRSLDFFKALDMYGAFSYIHFGNEYAKVPNSEIEKIKFLVGAKEIKGVKLDTQPLKVGDMKKISSGPLNGLECEILKVNNIKKVVVRVTSLRQNITATLPSYYLDDVKELIEKP